MKKLIENKLYDSATAQELCSEKKSDPATYGPDYKVLHRTSKGAFFYHTYSLVKNSTIKRDEDIEICSSAQAQEFYARYGGDTTKWKEIFGEDLEEA